MYPTLSAAERAGHLLSADASPHLILSREDLAELVRFAKLGERVQVIESRVELTDESLYYAGDPAALIRDAARRVVANVQREIPVTIEHSEDYGRLTRTLSARAYALREADSVTDARDYQFEDLGEHYRRALPRT
ncbi:hypothetical protein SEA_CALLINALLBARBZ_33 [Arthrobacter phage CallinAllBarbz]|uniref:Uncharacterized protein n=1 Tax=Arthrobacter phage CallinAllBarbz TaxID=3077790 RepID=A0AA96HJC6_9CAUD|nr:hypothetical protein SEA_CALLINALLBARBZ_33 [Arthrobacter phage CallinAllBarbz]